eukprot:CAMPEP_0174269848 /NCGR_PEP_ID=MMETSP0439-20130205/42517_1 /TAXON_ID=0 /ORGANISM="Stereomyxa ramosa, Strain Chinc5" /LENGTH=49 /DNA_ID= /DNA_START= /DNA_END= /DNA_ORIENTATION=
MAEPEKKQGEWRNEGIERIDGFGVRPSVGSVPQHFDVVSELLTQFVHNG